MEVWPKGEPGTSQELPVVHHHWRVQESQDTPSGSLRARQGGWREGRGECGGEDGCQWRRGSEACSLFLHVHV